MNKLNLDISQYSTDELQDIFNTKNSFNPTEIKSHFDSIKTVVFSDTNLSLEEKDNINNFLNDVVNKLIGSLDITSNLNYDDSLSKDKYIGTFAALQNNLVKDTPESHSLIQNPNTTVGQYAQIHTGKGARDSYYPPGYINPINRKTIKRVLNLDTRFRSSYYSTLSSNFHIDLPVTFKQVVKMEVTNLDLPLSLYAINSSNNCFSIDGHNIDISLGNYVTPFTALNYKDSSANLSDMIQIAINNSGVGDISYSINPVSGKSEFTSTGSHTIFFNKNCTGDSDLNTPLPLKMGWILGFRAGVYNLSGGLISSEGIATPGYSKYLFLCINDYTNASDNHYITAFTESVLSPHVIARLPYQDLLQDNGVYNFATEDSTFNFVRDYYGPVNIQKLHLQILDEYGRVVDFNNMDWSCTLTLDILYD